MSTRDWDKDKSGSVEGQKGNNKIAKFVGGMCEQCDIKAKYNKLVNILDDAIEYDQIDDACLVEEIKEVIRS